MKYCKDAIYGAIILAMLGLLIYQFFHKPVKTTNNIAELIKLDKKPSEEFTDEIGKNHSTNSVIYVTNDQAALLYRRQLDSVTAQLKVKDKQIAGLITASSKSEVTFIPNVKNIEDSLKRIIGQQISYTSKWFDLNGNTTPPKPTFKAVLRDSVTVAFIKDKYGFLNLKERLTADVSSANPDMQYYNMKSWMVPDAANNKAKLGLGLTLGYGVQMNKNNQFTHGWQATGGLQFRF